MNPNLRITVIAGVIAITMAACDPKAIRDLGRELLLSPELPLSAGESPELRRHRAVLNNLPGSEVLDRISKPEGSPRRVYEEYQRELRRR